MSTSITSNLNVSGYEVANVSEPEPAESSIPINTAPLLPANINELFQKLVSTGIITSALSDQKVTEPAKVAPAKKEKPANFLKPVYFDKMDTLKL